MTEVLRVEGLQKLFPVRRGVLQRVAGHVRAVDGVSFAIQAGETLCLVGESGCGKSTVGKTILRLQEPTAGQIWLGGTEVTTLDEEQMRVHRRQVQMVFQDPYSSLNPRMRAGQIIAEPLENFGLAEGAEKERQVHSLLEKVGLRTDAAERFPFEFSGGQRQRLGIARALALNPRLIVADEPVMYLGRIVELAPKDRIFDQPQHPYTEALMAAAPIADPKSRRKRLVIEGDVPSPMNPPPGCHFHTRCSYAIDRCRQEYPPLQEIAPGHVVACHLRTKDTLAAA